MEEVRSSKKQKESTPMRIQPPRKVKRVLFNTSPGQTTAPVQSEENPPQEDIKWHRSVLRAARMRQDLLIIEQNIHQVSRGQQLILDQIKMIRTELYGFIEDL